MTHAGNGGDLGASSSEGALERLEQVERRACSHCDGYVESVLTLVDPAASVCLECMSPEELGQLEQDLNQVQEVNRDLLSRAPSLDDWELHVHYLPSRLLSGDFYDVRTERATGRMSLLVGDVAGKGIPAGLLRSALQGALQALAGVVESPALVLRKANGHYMPWAQRRRFASVFHGVLELASGELRYANAGHIPPLVRRRQGLWESLETTGVVLGVLEEARYGEKCVALGPGDLLVLYSDGVTEAATPAGEFFETCSLRAALEGLTDAPVDVMARAVADALARFAPGTPGDDQTLLLLRRNDTRG